MSLRPSAPLMEKASDYFFQTRMNSVKVVCAKDTMMNDDYAKGNDNLF